MLNGYSTRQVFRCKVSTIRPSDRSTFKSGGGEHFGIPERLEDRTIEFRDKVYLSGVAVVEHKMEPMPPQIFNA